MVPRSGARDRSLAVRRAALCCADTRLATGKRCVNRAPVVAIVCLRGNRPPPNPIHHERNGRQGRASVRLQGLLSARRSPFLPKPGSLLTRIIGGPSIDRPCQKVALSEPFNGPGALGTIVDEPCPPPLAVVCPLHNRALHKQEHRSADARQQRLAFECSVSPGEIAVRCGVYACETQHQCAAPCSLCGAFLECALPVSATRVFTARRAPPASGIPVGGLPSPPTFCLERSFHGALANRFDRTAWPLGPRNWTLRGTGTAPARRHVDRWSDLDGATSFMACIARARVTAANAKHT
jgi:hypothetical protein